MHEFSFAMSVLDIASQEAERQNNSAVKAIRIRLGPLSGVVKSALVSAFGLAHQIASQTDCEIVVEEVPIIAYCSRCQANRKLDSPQWLCCPECGTPATDIRQGREPEVTALEIET